MNFKERFENELCKNAFFGISFVISTTLLFILIIIGTILIHPLLFLILPAIPVLYFVSKTLLLFKD